MIEDPRKKRVILGNIWKQERRSQGTQKKFDQARIANESQRVELAQQSLKIQEQRMSNLKKEMLIVMRGAAPFDDSGKPTTDKAREDARVAMKNIRKMYNDPRLKKELSFAKIMGLEKVFQQLSATAKTMKPLEIRIETKYMDLKAQLEDANKLIPLELRAKILPIMPDAMTAKPSELGQRLLTAGREVGMDQNKLDTINRLVTNIANTLGEIPKHLPLELFTSEDYTQEWQQGFIDSYTELGKLQEKMIWADPGTKEGKQAIQDYSVALSSFNKEGSKMFKDDWTGKIAERIARSGTGSQFVLALRDAVTAQKIMRKLEAGAKRALEQADPTGTQRQQLKARKKAVDDALATPAKLGLDQRVQELVVKPLANATMPMTIRDLTTSGAAAAAITTGLAEANVDKAKTGMSALETSAQNAASILNSIPTDITVTVQQITAPSSGEVQHKAKGGFISRGTDTVPAMLTPGEFIVNAKSTRKFYSELVSMNAGRQPIYRAQGGPVTTQTIGDIHVNVTGGSTSEKTIREIGPALRRELRRNNLILR